MAEIVIGGLQYAGSQVKTCAGSCKNIMKFPIAKDYKESTKPGVYINSHLAIGKVLLTWLRHQRIAQKKPNSS